MLVIMMIVTAKNIIRARSIIALKMTVSCFHKYVHFDITHLDQSLGLKSTSKASFSFIHLVPAPLESVDVRQIGLEQLCVGFPESFAKSFCRAVVS